MDAKIRGAALDLLKRNGYGRLTLEAVAGEAGVSRNSVYRRWRSKPELVFGVVFSPRDEFAVPDTGSLGGDLAAAFALFAADFRRPEVEAAIGGLIVDARSDDALRRRFRETVDAATKDALGEIVRRARERGEAVQVDVEALAHLLVGGALYQSAVLGADPGPVIAAVEGLFSQR